MADVEVMEMAYRYILALGLGPRAVLKLNSLGTKEWYATFCCSFTSAICFVRANSLWLWCCSQRAYNKALRAYLEQHKAALSDMSRMRLDRGSVLRVLDSKEIQDLEIVANAPSLHESLSAESRAVRRGNGAHGRRRVHLRVLVWFHSAAFCQCANWLRRVEHSVCGGRPPCAGTGALLLDLFVCL